MPIKCKHCKKRHEITPLSAQEATLMRAFLLNDMHKSYFCDLLCYYRFRQPFHPDGYQSRTKSQLMHDQELMDSHPNWRVIPWVVESIKKSQESGHDGPVVLEKEEKIVEDAIEKARQEEEDRRAILDAYDQDYGDDYTNDQLADIVLNHARRQLEAWNNIVWIINEY